jgi:hypothetical protein
MIAYLFFYFKTSFAMIEMNSYPSTHTYIIFEKIMQFPLLASDPSTGSLPHEIGACGVHIAMMISSCIAQGWNRRSYSAPSGLIYHIYHTRTPLPAVLRCEE